MVNITLKIWHHPERNIVASFTQTSHNLDKGFIEAVYIVLQSRRVILEGSCSQRGVKAPWHGRDAMRGTGRRFDLPPPRNLFISSL
jgi:hypothetical protein